MTTRRTFLQHLAVASALLGAGGCRTSRAEGEGDAQVLLDPPAPLVTSTVAVVRPSAYPTLVAAVQDAVARAGGLGFVREGQTVLLKPAVNSGKRYPATTDPEVVLAVARLVLEAGGRPFIADRTMFLRSTERAFRELGLDEAARQAGIPCRSLDHAEVTRVLNPRATHWDGAVPLYRPAAEADHVINLCTPRTHKLGDFTMALKNNVGLVQGAARAGMHRPSGFKERLAELSLVVRPSLVLMDGRQGFTDGGPDSGDLARLDFLAASADPVAVDAVGLGFLRLAGTNARLAGQSIWRLPVLAHAAALGLGAGAGARIALVGGLAPDDEARLRRELA